MLLIWWDWKGILYYELLPPNKTINSNVYCEKLDKFKKEIEKKTPKIGQSEGLRLPSRQWTTSYFFEDEGKIEGTRLGCFTASTLFSISCIFRLVPFQILGTLFFRKKFESEEDLKISLL